MVEGVLTDRPTLMHQVTRGGRSKEDVACIDPPPHYGLVLATPTSLLATLTSPLSPRTSVVSGEEGEDISSVVAEENYDDDFDDDNNDDDDNTSCRKVGDRGRDTDKDDHNVDPSTNNRRGKDSREKEKNKQDHLGRGADGSHGGVEISEYGLSVETPQTKV